MIDSARGLVAQLPPQTDATVVLNVRIAYLIINHNKREGTSRAVAEVAERLAKRHEVHVFSRSAEGVDLSSIRWHRLPGFGYPHIAEFLGYVLPCMMAVRRKDYDVIHAAGAVYRGADFYTIQNIQPAKRKVLAAIEHHERVGLMRQMTRKAYLTGSSWYEHVCYERSPGNFPWFLPVSSGVERELREYYDIGSAPVRIIPNATDTSIFRPLPSDLRASWRAHEGLGANDLVLAFSGGEWHRKGLDLAIRALALIKDLRVKLLVLGCDSALHRFEQLSAQLGVRDRVVFAGFKRDVHEGLAASDLFFFPSRYEAFSLATIEAAACGLPVVATRINGTEDFIQPGVNGLFVEPDVENMASVLRSILADNETMRAMGFRAREIVEQHYTWDRVAVMTEEAYLENLECNKRS